MTKPEPLAEDLKTLVANLRAACQPRWISKGVYTGPKSSSGIDCASGNAAADAIESLLATIDALKARQEWSDVTTADERTRYETWDGLMVAI